MMLPKPRAPARRAVARERWYTVPDDGQPAAGVMDMTSLKPTYAENNPSVRICYVMNGKWRLQKHDGTVSERRADDVRAVNVRDHSRHCPWQNWSPELDHDEALRVLGQYARSLPRSEDVAPVAKPKRRRSKKVDDASFDAQVATTHGYY